MAQIGCSELALLGPIIQYHALIHVSIRRSCRVTTSEYHNSHKRTNKLNKNNNRTHKQLRKSKSQTIRKIKITNNWKNQNHKRLEKSSTCMHKQMENRTHKRLEIFKSQTIQWENQNIYNPLGKSN